MPAIKPKLIAARNHVIANRGRYAVIATLAVCGVLHRAQVKEMNTFLDAHGLTDEYYTPESE